MAQLPPLLDLSRKLQRAEQWARHLDGLETHSIQQSPEKIAAAKDTLAAALAEVEEAIERAREVL